MFIEDDNDRGATSVEKRLIQLPFILFKYGMGLYNIRYSILITGEVRVPLLIDSGNLL